MRLPVFSLAALFVPLVVSAQTFPSIADVSRTLSILQPGMDVQAITVDTTGNVYLAGTSSSGFTGATTRLGPLGEVDLFVIKTNATADQVLYATAIGGSGSEALRSIQVDANGSLYLLGSTISQDFPSTSKVNPGFPVGAIALKLNPAGNAFVYAAQMGSRMTALAMDIDSAGAAFIVGATNTIDLATTPGVLKPQPTTQDYMGFVLKLAPAGSSFQIATYFGPADRSVEAVSVRSNGILIIADGNMVLLNNTLTQQLSTTPLGMVAVNMAFDSTGNIHLAGRSPVAAEGFLLKRYSAVGQQLTLSKTYPLAVYKADTASLVGGTEKVVVSTPRIAVTTTGRIYLFGQPTAPNFPTVNTSQPCMANIAAPNGIAGLPTIDGSGGLIGATAKPVPPDQGILVLDPNGNILHATFTTAVVTQAAVAPGNGRIYAAVSETLFTSPEWTQWRGLIRINQDLIPPDKASPSCVVHGASFNPVRVSPGAIMTIFGTHLGPSTFTSFTLPGGVVEKVLGGTSVTVEGKAAPMLFSWDKQINFIVPWTIRTDGTAVPLCVTFDGVTTCVQVGTTTAVTGAFQRGAVTAALNQNGSIHETTSPAAPGSVVQLFMTGFGAVEGTLLDGGVAGSTLQLVKGNVTASTEPPPVGGCGLFACAAAGGFRTVDVGFAGAAPGLVLGVNQVNIKIPDDMPSGLQSFTISFKPTGAKDAITSTVQVQIR